MSRTYKEQCANCYRVKESPIHDTGSWAEAHCKRCRMSGGHPVWNTPRGGVSSNKVQAHHEFVDGSGAFTLHPKPFPVMAGVTFGDD